MPKPDNVTDEMIEEWNNVLENDEMIIQLLEMPGARETLLAGMWLFEKLLERNCPENFVVQLQYTAGKLSYGNDPWEVHQKILDAYDNNKLVFETNSTTTLN